MLYSGLIAFLDRDQWQSEPCGLRHSLSGRDDRDVQYAAGCRRGSLCGPEDDRAMGNHNQ